MKIFSPSAAFVSVFFFMFCSELSSIEANNNYGFTVNLIHRDSPESPFYNPNLTHFQRLHNTFERSIERSRKFASYLVATGGSYLIKIGYGTPPAESFAVVDTGSELTWTQCLPCLKCFPSKFPPFNTKTSSTFRPLLCNPSTNCQNSNLKNASCKPMICSYEIGYGDNSYTRGNLVTDTITLSSRSQKISFQNVIFGCGHDNAGTYDKFMSGIIGLTTKKRSLVSQLNGFMHGKFSFCLAPFTQVFREAGKLSFGNEGIVSGPGVVSTPLYIGTHYNLNLKAVLVGTKSLKVFDYHFPMNHTMKLGGGNIVIDSGSTLTYFPTTLYAQFERMMRSQIRVRPLSRPEKPFYLCYPARGFFNIPIPIVVFRFLGADVKLRATNIFIQSSPSAVCLAIIPTRNDAIFGNIAQTNFLVGYNLIKGIVSFKPTDCNRY
ncbi:hypothetical protein M9H77_30468 [Catharanthus roseus]|uniref:Uncharacterized protein n=1 Tax=Catharanthus roseus TaxID=4058 RepID=A0ACC0A198_CATRO|nr:hypothetical protein M9H77_30468 [Catharanthus roseus]